MAKPEEIIENLDKNFNEDEFKEFDRTFGDLIKNGEFDLEMFSRRKEKEKTFLKRSLTSFMKMCENHEILFRKTRVYRELLRRTFIADYLEIEEVQFEKNIKEYLEEINETHFIVNARIANEIINATRLKRYDFYGKIENVLKNFAQDYDLSKYKEIITKKVSLSKDEFYDFIKEVNNAKIKEGLIPYEICEYLICEMLKDDSIITIERDFWANLRESVFCDFISHMEMKEYHMGLTYRENFFQYIQNPEEKNSICSFNIIEQAIRIEPNAIYQFNANYILPIVNVFRVLFRLRYTKELSVPGGYLRLKDYNIDENDSISKCLALKNGAINAITFLEQLGAEVNNLKIDKDTLLIDYKDKLCREYDEELARKFLTQNISQELEKVLQEKQKNLLQYGLDVEYNVDGTRKTVKEILENIEDAYINNKEFEKNKEKLKYSALDISYFSHSKDYINEIMNYEYRNLEFKKICFEVCKENLEEGIRLVEFLNDEAKKEEILSNLKEQLSIIDMHKAK